MPKEMSGRASARLKKFRKNVDRGYQFMKDNYERYNKFTKIVDVSTLSSTEKQYALAKNRPLVEFNELSRLINQFVGEFTKSQFGVSVGKKDGTDSNEEDLAMINFIEGHMRYQFHEIKINGIETHVCRQMVKGGFSSAKVFADYTENSGINQEIIVAPCYDPTLVGFDPFAMKPDKTDGDFMYEGIPYSKEKAEDEFNITLSELKSTYNPSGYKWSFKNANEEVVMVVDYYYKKYKYINYILLSNEDVIEESEYEDYVRKFNDYYISKQAPVILAGPIRKKKTTIWRAKIVGNHIIEEEPTSLSTFPIKWAEGNAGYVKDPSNSSVEYIAKPYVYDLLGAQRLKNYAGQSLMYSLMKTVQSPFMASNESLRGQNPEPWRNPQDANILIYNEFKDNDPNVRISPPIPISPAPIPPEIMQAFTEADRTIQNIAGGFDLGSANMSEKEMSGKAIQQAQTLGNAAAQPFVEGMRRWAQSIAESILEMIPFYYTTPRSVPVMDERGRRSYVKVNGDGGLSMEFEPTDFEIKIEAGSSFTVQQERTKQEIVALANAIPAFGQFIGDAGIPTLLDNLGGIRGIENLKKVFDDWQEGQKQMQAQMSQMPNPEVMKMEMAQEKVAIESAIAQQKMMIEDREAKIKALTDIGKIKIDKEKNRIDAIKALSDAYTKVKSVNMQEDKLEYDKLMQVIEAYSSALQQDYDEMERNFQRAITKYESENRVPSSMVS